MSGDVIMLWQYQPQAGKPMPQNPPYLTGTIGLSYQMLTSLLQAIQNGTIQLNQYQAVTLQVQVYVNRQPKSQNSPPLTGMLYHKMFDFRQKQPPQMQQYNGGYPPPMQQQPQYGYPPVQPMAPPTQYGYPPAQPMAPPQGLPQPPAQYNTAPPAYRIG